MKDTYQTIITATEGIYKEKGSRFISIAQPVNSIEEVKEIIKDYRKKYYDARHVCYAYMLGTEQKEWRANDDGEPSGTAGNPILGQIKSRELTNILVVVIRYFGGVLLGTGGLVVAYREAAFDALQQAEIIEKTIQYSLCIHFEYPLMNEVMRITKECDAQIVNQSYENDCKMNFSIRKSTYNNLVVRLKKIDGVIFEQKND
jgi:uncharacterized YigZ family protein